jgi:hypothetical protein
MYQGKTTVRLVPVLIFMLVGIVAAAQGFTISTASVTAAAGGSVQVPVNAEGAQNVGSLDIAIQYDPAALEFVSAKNGELLKGMVSSSTDGTGVLALAIIDSKGISGKGSIVMLTFNVKGKDGTVSPVTVKSARAGDLTTLGDIPVTVSSGSVSIGQVSAEKKTPGFAPALAITAFALVPMVRRVIRKSR